MKSLGKVVWQDGMHLSQHHFQAQSRYFEELLHFVAGSLAPEAYGIAGVAFEDEALKNDTVSLVHGRGLMPDGLPFDFPQDPLPATRQIREVFSPTEDAHLVLLCVPPFGEGRANVAAEGQDTDGRRFISTVRMVADEVGGPGEKPIAVARKNFRLLLDGEDTTGLVTLPVARVRRDGAGHFVYDTDFIPPSLRIGASPALVALLTRLLEQLAQRVERLTGTAASQGDDLVGRWMAQAIHESLGPLLHFHRSRDAHPSELFQVLARLAGSLSTFSLTLHPRDLPTYDHGRPGEAFREVARRIRDVLELVTPSNTLVLPFRRVEESFRVAAIGDSRSLGRAEWFLGVRSPGDAAELPARVPRLLNLCSAKHIQRLVREAIPGLALTHVASPPPGISPRPGTAYFSISRAGPCWASIQETGEVGLYVPAAIEGAEVELVVAIEGSG